MELLESEEIRDIPGYEDTLSSTTFGRIWRKPRIWFAGIRGNIKRENKGLWAPIKLHRQGYVEIDLRINNIKSKQFAHRLVSLTFIPNPNNLSEINHINGIKDDNNICNLEWVSALKNMNHAKDNKLIHPNMTSNFDGVCWGKRELKWRAYCYVGRKQEYLGTYIKEIDAAIAYNDFIIGNNYPHRLNEIPQ